jgi:hypothetical protein
MLRFIESEITVFVLTYDAVNLSRSSFLDQVAGILSETGFVLPGGGHLNLASEQAVGEEYLNAPISMLLNGGEAFLDWKVLLELEGPVVELQIGSVTSIPVGMFSQPYYSPEMRDRLVGGLERLCGLAGFIAGFEVHLGNEFAGEGIYRGYFNECLVKRRLSLARLVHHEYLPVESLFVGKPYLDVHGREMFLRCPAWRVSQPSEHAVCVFLHNLFPTGKLMRTHGESFIREGLAHLRSALGRE